MNELYIKLNPYLQEYFICRYNNNVKCDSKSIIGVVVHEFLKYLPKGSTPVFERGDCFLNVTIGHTTDKVNTRGNIFISSIDQQKICRLLNVHFKESFFTYMDGYVAGNGMKIGVLNNAMLSFCEMNMITYNRINFELLTKSYYRHRLRKSNSNIFVKNNQKTLPNIVRPILTAS